MTATHNRSQPKLVPKARRGYLEIADRINDVIHPKLSHSGPSGDTGEIC